MLSNFRNPLNKDLPWTVKAFRAHKGDSWHSGHGDSSCTAGCLACLNLPTAGKQLDLVLWSGSVLPALLTLLVLEAPQWNSCLRDFVLLSLSALSCYSLNVNCSFLIFFSRFCLLTILYMHITHFHLSLDDISDLMLLAQRGCPVLPLA